MSPQESSSESTLQAKNISQVAWAELRSKPILFYGGIAAAITLDILLFSVMLDRDWGDAIESLFLPWLPLFLWYVHTAAKARKRFWQLVAEKKGWSYAETDDVSDEEALFLNTGHSHSISNMISGTEDSIPVRAFESMYTVGSGKNKQTYTFSCFAFRFEGSFPHLYLNRNDNQVSFISNREYQIPLPGEFGEKFTLYAPKEYEIEALQIFTPDLLEYLLQTNWLSDIEFVDHEFIVFRKGFISSYDEFTTELASASKIASRFADTLQRMQFAPIPHTSHLLRDATDRQALRGMIHAWPKWLSFVVAAALVIMVMYWAYLMTELLGL
ncbi:MAG: hypothetical protein KC877_04115 [Candidatus Kaiserbacteria bacterium]|nr:hypothetical protein [Candidatus Kaiserbacteria bacterium]MCB9815806.1 hypothetical protein [Candidatus Nomurabacteria bacterium]